MDVTDTDKHSSLQRFGNN